MTVEIDPAEMAGVKNPEVNGAAIGPLFVDKVGMNVDGVVVVGFVVEAKVGEDDDDAEDPERDPANTLAGRLLVGRNSLLPPRKTLDDVDVESS